MPQRGSGNLIKLTLFSLKISEFPLIGFLFPCKRESLFDTYRALKVTKERR